VPCWKPGGIRKREGGEGRTRVEKRREIEEKTDVNF
jgi:hypothetical protein